MKDLITKEQNKKDDLTTIIYGYGCLEESQQLDRRWRPGSATKINFW